MCQLRARRRPTGTTCFTTGTGHTGRYRPATAPRVVAGAARWRYWGDADAVPDLVASDASVQVVREYVGEFDPDAVSDPFE